MELQSKIDLLTELINSCKIKGVKKRIDSVKSKLIQQYVEHPRLNTISIDTIRTHNFKAELERGYFTSCTHFK